MGLIIHDPFLAALGRAGLEALVSQRRFSRMIGGKYPLASSACFGYNNA
ncbi:hypothetical protein AB8878_05015 [Alphaproteobacteria bacterium LSUCC0226]